MEANSIGYPGAIRVRPPGGRKLLFRSDPLEGLTPWTFSETLTPFPKPLTGSDPIDAPQKLLAPRFISPSFRYSARRH
jgi:hypothetical protein